MGSQRNHGDVVAATVASQLRALDECRSGILITDPRQNDNPIVYCNRAFKQLTGYRPDEVIGKNCRFLQANDRSQPGLDELRTAIAKGEPCCVVLRNYRKDGSLFWNELSISPVRDERGELIHFIGIQRDVSRQRMLEVAAQERERLSKLLREIEQATLVNADSEGAVRRLAGFLRDTSGAHAVLIGEAVGAVGTDPAVVLRHSCLAESRSERKALSARSWPIRLWESAPVRKAASECIREGAWKLIPSWQSGAANVDRRRRLSLAFVPIVFQGRCVGLVLLVKRAVNRAVAWEMTGAGPVLATLGVVLAAARIRSDEEAVWHHDRISAVGELSITLAHEISQPLGAISTYAGILCHGVQSGVISEKTMVQAVSMLERLSLQAGEILHRVKDFVGPVRLQPQEISVGELMERIRPLAEACTSEMELRLEIIQTAGFPRVLADPVLLQQVLLNLLRNAAQATDVSSSSSTKIVVDAQYCPSDKCVCFRVSDSGPGIPIERIFSVFEPFQTEKLGGLGLGLSLCRRIVETHGGKMWCEQNEPRGARFCFTIPTAP